MPRSARISSASSVVGPFAPSAISAAWTSPAFSAVSCSSSAARTRTSHGSSSSSSFVTASPPGYVDQLVPVLVHPDGDRVEVEPLRVVRPAGHVRDGHDLRPVRGQLLGCDRADLPEALDDAALSRQRPAEPLARSLRHHHHARAGRLRAKDGAPDRDRLPGHDLGHGIALLHRVRVHHPGHRLLVGGHVRRGDVLLRPDHGHHLGGEAPGQALELGGSTARAGCSGRRPSPRRTGGAGARTSRSSTSRAPRTRRASRAGRSGSRPWSARARSSAARGSRAGRARCRRPSAPASKPSSRAPGSGAARRPRRGRSRTGAPARTGCARSGTAACPTRAPTCSTVSATPGSVCRKGSAECGRCRRAAPLGLRRMSSGASVFPIRTRRCVRGLRPSGRTPTARSIPPSPP